MGQVMFPVTCPLCGKRNDFPIEMLKEGTELVCPFCRVRLNLHGHMLQEIQEDLAGRKKEDE